MRKDIEDAARSVAAQIGVPSAHWLAVVEVESGGQALSLVDGVQKPVIRFEGHLFYRLLGPGAKRDRAARAGLAHPKWGVVKNPSSQQARWDKLIKPAIEIDRVAALSACSVGLGQVLLSHWKAFGYESVDAMYEVAGTIEGQLLLMAKFCQVNSAVDEIQTGDWKGFARIYNGPQYAKHGYDKRLSQAAAKWGGKTAQNTGLLTVGAKGAKVREVQALLSRAGYSVGVDGDFGPSTKQAVSAFQDARGLTVDGKVGTETWTALIELRQSPEERPGVPGPAESVMQTPEGRQGGVTTILGGSATASVNAAKDQIEPLTGTSATIDTIFTVLTIVGVVLAIGGVAWMAWGYFKANRTES